MRGGGGITRGTPAPRRGGIHLAFGNRYHCVGVGAHLVVLGEGGGGAVILGGGGGGVGILGVLGGGAGIGIVILAFLLGRDISSGGTSGATLRSDDECESQSWVPLE